MNYGYARVSTKTQRLDRQLVVLREHQLDHLFQEKASGATLNRPQLQALIAKLQPNDTIYVTSLDRLSRNTEDITTLLLQFHLKGACLNCLNIPDFTSINNQNLQNLLKNLLIEVNKFTAEEERHQIRKRQQEGIRLAKLRGAYKGKRIVYSADSPNPNYRRIYNQIKTMIYQGKTTYHITRQLGISNTLVNRIRHELSTTRHSSSIKNGL